MKEMGKTLVITAALFMTVMVCFSAPFVRDNLADDRMVNEFVEEINQREDAEAHVEVVEGQKVVFVGYYDENGTLRTGEILGLEEIRKLRD